MALKMNVNLENGINLNEAYIRVISVGGTKENLTIEVGIYVNEDYANNNNYVNKKYCNFVPSVEDTANNWIKQAYEHLKTLDEYKDSADC